MNYFSKIAVLYSALFLLLSVSPLNGQSAGGPETIVIDELDEAFDAGLVLTGVVVVGGSVLIYKTIKKGKRNKEEETSRFSERDPEYYAQLLKRRKDKEFDSITYRNLGRKRIEIKSAGPGIVFAF